MFTLVVYSVCITIVLLFLKCFTNIISRVGLYVGKGTKPNGVDIGTMILIIKKILILIFVFTMTSSVFLYIYYHLPVDIAKDLNSTIMNLYNKSTDYTIVYSAIGENFYYFQKITGRCRNLSVICSC